MSCNGDFCLRGGGNSEHLCFYDFRTRLCANDFFTTFVTVVFTPSLLYVCNLGDIATFYLGDSILSSKLTIELIVTGSSSSDLPDSRKTFD